MRGGQGLRVTALIGLALLMGCGGGPDVDLITGSEPVASRRGLRDLAQAGPVPVVIQGPEAPATPAVLEALERGIYGVGTNLEAMADPRGPHLVARFGAGPRSLCDPLGAGMPESGAVALAYCDQGELVAAATSEAPVTDEEMRLRTIAVAARRVFPDDYDPSYYGLYPRFGIGIGTGGVRTGIGIGIGF